MAKQGTSTSPFQAMEEEAHQAFLEWPVWLVLREKELAAYLDAPATNRPQANARAASGARGSTQSTQEINQ